MDMYDQVSTFVKEVQISENNVGRNCRFTDNINVCSH
jgi:hypothetical protein